VSRLYADAPVCQACGNGQLDGAAPLAPLNGRLACGRCRTTAAILAAYDAARASIRAGTNPGPVAAVISGSNTP
jgi:ribosomal protein S27AE